jgi:hypothetical protein
MRDKESERKKMRESDSESKGGIKCPPDKGKVPNYFKVE